MRNDIFLVDAGVNNTHLVYAPKHMAMFVVNATGAKAFRRLQTGEEDDQTKVLVQTMEKNGLTKEPPPMIVDIQHADLTICPTFRCNLACQYCFARGGERLDDLDLEKSKTAIDWALTRYPKNEARKVSRLTWHGGGEPTLAWPLIKEVSRYHKEKALEMGLGPETSIVSNGLWSDQVYDWVVSELVEVTISCDGPADIQDLHRPLIGGGQSSYHVYKMLRRMRADDVDFGIRSTITQHNVGRMPDMVEFFYKLCQPKTLQFERLAICGRCEDSRIKSGSAEDYINYFKKAFDVAHNLGIKLSCSGVRIFRRTSNFCGAAGRTVCVMPNGLLTTCHRVDNLSDPIANEFVFGGWQNRSFQWDKAQLIDLSEKLNIEQLSWCQDCFCKYTCGVDVQPPVSQTPAIC